MFENVTWQMVGMVSLYVGIGLVLRTFVPWLRVAYDLMKKTNEWKLPRFEPKYVLPPAATLGVYGFAVLTEENAIPLLHNMSPPLLILGVYLGEDLIRKALKSLLGS